MLLQLTAAAVYIERKLAVDAQLRGGIVAFSLSKQCRRRKYECGGNGDVHVTSRRCCSCQKLGKQAHGCRGSFGELLFPHGASRPPSPLFLGRAWDLTTTLGLIGAAVGALPRPCL